MYETTYVKDKMAAFAQYSVAKELRREKNPNLKNVKSQVFFSEVKNNTDEDMKEAAEGAPAEATTKMDTPPPFPPPPLKMEPSPPAQQPPQRPKEAADAHQQATAGASIRVASRSSSVSGAEDEKGARGGCNLSSAELAKATKLEVLMESIEGGGKRTLTEEEQRKLLALKRRVAEIKEGLPFKGAPLFGDQPRGAPPPEHDQEEAEGEEDAAGLSCVSPGEERSAAHDSAAAQSGPKLAIKRYSNVIIGKMPFLKRPKGAPGAGRGHAAPAEQKGPGEGDALSVSGSEARVRQVVAEGLLPPPPPGIHEAEPLVSLPPVVPRNVEYITEIESSGTQTTFTKKFGPTLDAPVSSDDESEGGRKDTPPPPPPPPLVDIPVPVEPPDPFRSGVDLHASHFGQRSTAAAVYKEAIRYQPLPLPPVPPMMTGVPPPIMPPLPPPMLPHPFGAFSDPLTDGLNPPPPPGTEGGSSNSSLNAGSEAVDSPDSLLCQKTPPPPGTEDEPLQQPQQQQQTRVKKTKPEFFKEILADVPVMSFDSSRADEGSQESLVQEGLELLEFADEDEEEAEEK